VPVNITLEENYYNDARVNAIKTTRLAKQEMIVWWKAETVKMEKNQ
jgi:hypothetical protein